MMRESQAAVALVREWRAGGWVFLCQWSDTWNALHFIGGHREPGETFRRCAVREAAEELAVAEGELDVAAEPLARFEYVAFSRSAGVDTRYVMEVFPTCLTAAARARATGRPENCWVGLADVRAGRTADGRPVSPSVALILGKLGLFPTE